jgi:hypothetical protein
MEQQILSWAYCGGPQGNVERNPPLRYTYHLKQSETHETRRLASNYIIFYIAISYVLIIGHLPC